MNYDNLKVTLFVYIVSAQFITKPQSVEAFIGAAVNLSCSADGFPVPDITWTFQGMPFTNETVNSSNSTYTESTIVITNLLLSHGGSYSCQISGAGTVTLSNNATLEVIGGKTFNTYVCTYYGKVWCIRMYLFT